MCPVSGSTTTLLLNRFLCFPRQKSHQFEQQAFLIKTLGLAVSDISVFSSSQQILQIKDCKAAKYILQVLPSSTSAQQLHASTLLILISSLINFVGQSNTRLLAMQNVIYSKLVFHQPFLLLYWLKHGKPMLRHIIFLMLSAAVVYVSVPKRNRDNINVIIH